MIPGDVSLGAARVPVTSIRYTEHWDRDHPRLWEFVKLLRDNPDKDLDPVLVESVPQAYSLVNGHYRYLAYLIVGRITIPATIMYPKAGTENEQK